mgnify:FL=1
MKAEELRRSVLQLAVEGKLVEQRPEEGTARELLAEIAAERKQLVREGKMKKGKPLAPVSPDEVSFEIPENWEWVRLGDVVYNFGQKNPDTPFTYIDVASIDNVKGCLTDNLLVLPPADAPSRARKIVKKGCVLYATIRPYLLNICIIDQDFSHEPIASTAFAVLNPFSGLLNQYLYYVLRSPVFIDYVNDQMTGMAYPAINDEKLYSGYIPLPPLAEQRRIVARLGELMPLIDAYEAEERRLSALETEFPEQLRRSLLQYAVEGKLVEQRPEEGTARELLAEIAAERERLIREGKMKQSKPLAPVSPDEVPFEIPESWEWVRLGEIINLVSGQHIETSNYNTEGKGIAYLTGPADFGTKITVITRWTEHPKVIVEKNSILITVKGAGVGKTNILSETAAISRQLMAIMPIGIFDAYVLIFLKYYESAISNMKSGTTIPGISREDILGISLPLPPLAEQRRIVARLEELMPLIDTVRNKNTVSSEGGL